MSCGRTATNIGNTRAGPIVCLWRQCNVVLVRGLCVGRRRRIVASSLVVYRRNRVVAGAGGDTFHDSKPEEYFGRARRVVKTSLELHPSGGVSCRWAWILAWPSFRSAG